MIKTSNRSVRAMSLAGLWAVLSAMVASRALAAPEASVQLDDAADRQVIEQLLADMIALPEGQFEMGDIDGDGEGDERPVREVKVYAFALNRYEVTFAQYDVFARATGRTPPKDRWGRGNQPVIDVTWKDADAFAKWLATITGLPFRLPSESEWEYAARGGTSSKYFFGDDETQLCEYANVADSDTTIGWRTQACSDGYGTTAPVGSFKPNAFGFYDLTGNVWEWVEDCWNRNHRGAPDDSKPRVKSRGCDERVQRGGSWFYGSDEARSSYRTSGKEDEKSVTAGFRVAYAL